MNPWKLAPVAVCAILASAAAAYAAPNISGFSPPYLNVCDPAQAQVKFVDIIGSDLAAPDTNGYTFKSDVQVMWRHSGGAFGAAPVTGWSTTKIDIQYVCGGPNPVSTATHIADVPGSLEFQVIVRGLASNIASIPLLPLGAVPPPTAPPPAPPPTIEPPGRFTASFANPSNVLLTWTSPTNASWLELQRGPNPYPNPIRISLRKTNYVDTVPNLLQEYVYSLCTVLAPYGHFIGRQCVSASVWASGPAAVRPTGPVIGSASNPEGHPHFHRIAPPTAVQATFKGVSGGLELVNVTWTASSDKTIDHVQVRYHHGTNALGAWLDTGPQLAANATHYTASILPAPAGSNVYISVCGVAADETRGCSLGVQVPSH